jgi:hypothetical protein
MPESFDLDALANDANATPFPFTFGGEDYELPPEIDVLDMAMLSTPERVMEGLIRLLGADQVARMEKSDARLTPPKLEALVKAYMAHLGVDLGEAPASSGS